MAKHVLIVFKCLSTILEKISFYLEVICDRWPTEALKWRIIGTRWLSRIFELRVPSPLDLFYKHVILNLLQNPHLPELKKIYLTCVNHRRKFACLTVFFLQFSWTMNIARVSFFGRFLAVSCRKWATGVVLWLLNVVADPLCCSLAAILRHLTRQLHIAGPLQS